jgi:hypothetical protein
MAEFSKQYCQLNDMGFDGDFDVYEEWAKLKPGFTVAYICEGFGFLAIGKRESGDSVLVFMDNYDEHGGKWIDFDEMVLAAKSNS